jgi:hypothetical protein
MGAFGGTILKNQMKKGENSLFVKKSKKETQGG